ncbi:MAG TPA: hypothetical protein VHM91_19655 [Verrucomicrobiales bacterium]|jgi:hypothetical protein|nr:hypothetical protein [Verrucomicrobiales bacterium]
MAPPLQQLAHAEAKLLLGLYSEAWELIDSLPFDAEDNPRAVAVKLMICEGRKDWEEGKRLAEGVTVKCSANERQAAGRFLLSLAMATKESGDYKGARAAVVALCRVWPEGKHLALGSKELSVLW